MSTETLEHYLVNGDIEAWKAGGASVTNSEAPIQQYLVSDDLGLLADTLAASPNFPNRASEDSLNTVRTILGEGLNQALADYQLRYIGVQRLSGDVRRVTEEMKQRRGAAVVTLDAHYLPPNPAAGTYPLHITRIYDEKTGERLGRGARPHFRPIEDQISAIVQQTGYKPIILAESGIVTGGTIKRIVDAFAARGSKVKGLSVGIATSSAVKELLDQYPGLEIASLVTLDKNVLDWTEAKDLLAFVPGSGQTVGRQSRVDANRYIPLFSPQYRNHGYAIPYPLGKENRWASLSDAGTPVMRIAGLRATKELFTGVEEANERKRFTFGDLLKIAQATDAQEKVTLPWLLAGYGKNGKQIDATTRILDIVDHMLDNVVTLPDGKEVLLPESVTAHRLYPGGNETILVTTPVDREAYPEVARRLLQQYSSAEQVGYIENVGKAQDAVKLHMAGGEFCGNATRSMVWWLHNNPATRNPNGQYDVQVSGVDRLLHTSVDAENNVTVEMPIRGSLDEIKQIDDNTRVVRLDGITHVVVKTDQIDAKTSDEADLLLATLKLKEEDAAGVIYMTQQADGKLRINPFVHVRAVNTFFNETACASGTTAVGLSEAKNKRASIRTAIVQPSGHEMNIEVNFDEERQVFSSARISGPVGIIGTEDTPIISR